MKEAKVQRQVESRVARAIEAGWGGSPVLLGVEQYASLFSIDAPGYRTLGAELRDAELKLKQINPNLAGLYNQKLVIDLLKQFNPGRVGLKLPDAVLGLYSAEISRLGKELDTRPVDYYCLDNDVFLKDLAVLAGRLIPVGAEFVVPDAGVPRSWCLKGVKGGCSAAWACLACGGFSPYLELHMHPGSVAMFNPQGWSETYINLGALLELNPGLRGVISSSWFLDPALGQISPHLAYLHETSVQNGATLIFNCLDKSGDSGALSKSDSRRRLFLAGKYVPAIYSRIWPRRKLIAYKKHLLNHGHVA
ncbi:MAG: hypothetical protein R3E57_05350 [Porticoccaceae bacterium]